VSDPATSLSGLLESEAREASAFVELLRKEQAMLTAGNVDGLLPLVEQKVGFADRLGTLADAREKIVNDSGAGSGRAGMETYLSRRPADKDLRQRWERLLALATDAQAMNQTNGKLIRIHLRHNQQAMETLMAATNQATTYGPDGHQRPAGSGRFLGSA
jgi:flagella synthesis protein FlgN